MLLFKVFSSSRGGRSPWSTSLRALAKARVSFAPLRLQSCWGAGSFRIGSQVFRLQARTRIRIESVLPACSFHRFVTSYASRAAPRSTATVSVCHWGRAWRSRVSQLEDAVVSRFGEPLAIQGLQLGASHRCSANSVVDGADFAPVLNAAYHDETQTVSGAVDHPVSAGVTKRSSAHGRSTFQLFWEVSRIVTSSNYIWCLSTWGGVIDISPTDIRVEFRAGALA